MVLPVARPEGDRRGGIEAVSRVCLAHVERHRLEARGIPRRPERDDGLAVDRAGKDDALIIVDMLADQIDPPRRGKEIGRSAP